MSVPQIEKSREEIRIESCRVTLIVKAKFFRCTFQNRRVTSVDLDVDVRPRDRRRRFREVRPAAGRKVSQIF